MYNIGLGFRFIGYHGYQKEMSDFFNDIDRMIIKRININIPHGSMIVLEIRRSDLVSKYCSKIACKTGGKREVVAISWLLKQQFVRMA